MSRRRFKDWAIDLLVFAFLVGMGLIFLIYTIDVVLA